MSYQYCLIHKKMSAWGCPVCRSVELRRGMDEAVEKAREAIRNAFEASEAPKFPATRKPIHD